MPLYAAYGSNMDPEQMLERAPHSPMAGTGWLYGWRLTFAGEDIGWEGALATLVEDLASRVFVVLYDVTHSDEENMDRWEGSELGLHSKIRCRIVPRDLRHHDRARTGLAVCGGRAGRAGYPRPAISA